MLEPQYPTVDFCMGQQDSFSPEDRTRVMRDENDTILTPIEKLQRSDITTRNVDSMLSPTEKENAAAP